MADQKHISILKLGVQLWNAWRFANKQIVPNLSRTELNGANLSGFYLQEVNLFSTRLKGADLSGANLTRANLEHTDLTDAKLRDADLWMANFGGTHLSKADLTNCIMGESYLCDIDLSEVIGLETVRHGGPSTIGIDTIYKSRGRISEIFLHKAGVPENLVAYAKSLVGTVLDYYSCFISHSSKDQEFTERLNSDLQAKGVRCWYAPENLRIGDEFRQSIDEAIRFYDKLLLVLSKNSIQSPWVRDEVEGALEKERRQRKKVLFPVRLDGAAMRTREAWAASLRRTRQIGDFSEWKDHDSYRKAFQKLLRDLQGKSEKPVRKGE